MKNTGQQYARDSSRSTSGLRPFIGLLCWCALLTASAYAQRPPVYNFDDITTGWGLCTGPSCAGGTGNPTSTSQTFGNATPSLDGGSMLLTESGPANANTGWFYKPGPLDIATGFTLDLQFNIPDNSKIQAAEFDQFQYIFKDQVGASANTKLVFGTQCVTGDVPANDDWQVWDEFNQNWVHTHAPCSYIVSATAFNHLTIAVHRLAGDTSCSGTLPAPRFGLTTFTGPAMYYSITLNGTLVVSNQRTCSGPLDTGFQEVTGLQLQLDTSAACGSACTIKEYIDRGTFLATNVPWWPAIQQIILDD